MIYNGELLHFNPATVNAAIVTSGAICPGMQLHCTLCITFSIEPYTSKLSCLLSALSECGAASAQQQAWRVFLNTCSMSLTT